MCLYPSTLNDEGEWLARYTLKEDERVWLGPSTLNNEGEWLGPLKEEERVWLHGYLMDKLTSVGCTYNIKQFKPSHNGLSFVPGRVLACRDANRLSSCFLSSIRLLFAKFLNR